MNSSGYRKRDKAAKPAGLPMEPRWHARYNEQIVSPRVLKQVHDMTSSGAGEALQPCITAAASPVKAVRGTTKREAHEFGEKLQQAAPSLQHARAERDFGWDKNPIPIDEPVHKVPPPHLPKRSTKAESDVWRERQRQLLPPAQARYEFTMGHTAVGEALILEPPAWPEPKRADRLTTKEEASALEAAASKFSPSQVPKTARYNFSFNSDHLTAVLSPSTDAVRNVDENPRPKVKVRVTVCGLMAGFAIWCAVCRRA